MRTASKKSYVLVWIALLTLLLLTWGLAEINLGPFNNVAALCISVAKMLLVVLFFMHGRYEKALTWIFICAGVIWFLIMVDLTLSDYLTRGDVRDGVSTSWHHPQVNPPTLQPGTTRELQHQIPR
ncbi:MAG TPA: cytochrome C oxidase subunit IV family protein [Candidatus Angelobacter sp.]|nr:cytochrome C oxidase subunit IV family protein [Candidatus Angelobacter sp.]